MGRVGRVGQVCGGCGARVARVARSASAARAHLWAEPAQLHVDHDAHVQPAALVRYLLAPLHAVHCDPVCQDGELGRVPVGVPARRDGSQDAGATAIGRRLLGVCGARLTARRRRPDRSWT